MRDTLTAAAAPKPAPELSADAAAVAGSDTPAAAMEARRRRRPPTLPLARPPPRGRRGIAAAAAQRDALRIGSIDSLIDARISSGAAPVESASAQ